jgi:hypothetical protein
MFWGFSPGTKNYRATPQSKDEQQIQNQGNAMRPKSSQTDLATAATRCNLPSAGNKGDAQYVPLQPL